MSQNKMKPLKIFGCEYRVERYEDLTSMGRCWSKKQLIQIESGLSKSHEYSTMIHEILEAINWHLQIGLDNKDISQLETGLYQVLIDNGVDLSPLLEELNKGD